MSLRDKVGAIRDEARAKAAGKLEASQRVAEEKAAQRVATYDAAQASCPLPIQRDNTSLPGGQRLFDDEFLVRIGKDFGLSSQRLTLTTQRVIYTHGRLSKDVKSVYLTDVRDVQYHKPAIGLGSIVLDTASGKIEGLPAASKGAELRDQILSLVHWARQRVQQAPAAQAAPEDIPGKLAQLAQLRDSGVLSDEEFASAKTALLARL